MEKEIASGQADKIATVAAELSTRSKELEKREAEASALRSLIGKLEQQASTLRSSLDSEQQQRAASEKDVARLRGEAEQAKAALRGAEGRLAKAERSLKSQQDRARKQQSEVAALRATLDKSKRSSSRDRSREAALQKELREREAALKRERDRAGQLAASVDSLKGETGKLRSDLASREADDRKRQQTLAAAGPAIAILQPNVPTTRSVGLPTITTDADKTLVVGKVETASGLMALTINDVEVKPNDQGLFKATVPLKGDKTTVSVVAIDGAGKRSASQFVLARRIVAGGVRGQGAKPEAKPVPLDIKFGDYVALVIGNNDYKQLPKLETAVHDAQTVAGILQKRYAMDVRLLVNASRYDILSAMNDLRQELTDTDNLIIYYAGHGELDRANNRGHWLPVDSEPDSTANWISNIQITDVLNAMSVRQVLVVADSCYSGTLTRSSLASLEAGMSGEMRNNWLKMMAKKRARVVLSSGGVQPVLDSAGGKHSVFASAFIDVLNGNADVLEGQKLYHLVSQRVTSVRAAAEIEQLPQYAPIKYAGHEAGDFFFVPKI